MLLPFISFLHKEIPLVKYELVIVSKIETPW